VAYQVPQSQGLEAEGVSAAVRQAIESMWTDIERFSEDNVQRLQEQVARMQEDARQRNE